MFLKPYILGLDGIIPGGISVKDFSTVAETDHVTAIKILNELMKNGIGLKNNNLFYFNSGDRLKAALLILEKGGVIDEVSEHIDWKDFEGLVGEILESKGFGAIRNMILTKPKMEIDIIGIKLGVAMLIDCKHWKRTSSAAIQTAVKKQVERTKKYVAQTPGAMAVPAIVTLYEEKVSFINRVPIVPIQKFSSFVDELYGNLDQVETIKSD
ncbi:MAG TPA: restriction endonuclease [Nitrosopumilaceae archaeon]|nr:restriction endonuclease [Nitrosopumilaceae archaeon]